MPIRMDCPGCDEPVVVNDGHEGKKARCKGCGEVFVVKKDAAARASKLAAIQDGPKSSSRAMGGKSRRDEHEERPSRSRRRDDDDDDDDRPRSRRRKASTARMWIIIGSCGGGVLLLAIILLVVLSNKEDEPSKSDSKPIAQINDPRGNVQVNIPKDFGKDLGKKVPRDFNPNFPVDFPQPPKEDPDPINRALKGLEGTVFAQSDAAKSLEKMPVVELRRAQVVAALKKVIDNRQPLIPRGDCVRALSVWATRNDSQYLLNLLDDQDGGVRDNAMFALGKIKEERAISILVGRLGDVFQREPASKALKEFGSIAEPAVRDQLKSKDSFVRGEACNILKVIGTPASHPILLDLCDDEDGGVAQAAREALPVGQRPPIYTPAQTLTINVHIVNEQAWAAIEARIKALADAPRASYKARTSGQYKWVTLAPVNSDAQTFSRKVNFGQVTAVHNPQRLIYVESGQ